MKKEALLKGFLSVLLCGTFLLVAVVFCRLNSPPEAFAMSMVATDCKRCHGPDQPTVVEFHHAVMGAKGLSCFQCHGVLNDGTTMTVQVERDCTTCHTPGYHTEPAGSLRDRHHNMSNAMSLGCMHCHPLLADKSGTNTVVVARDCFYCHTDGQNPWKEVKWVTNLPDPAAPDATGTATDVTAIFQDTRYDSSYPIGPDGSFNKALNIRLDRDAATLSSVILGFYADVPTTPSTLVRIYPYLQDGSTVDGSAFLEYPVNAGGWSYFDVTSLASRMAGFNWMKFRMTSSGGVLSLSEGSYGIVNSMAGLVTNQAPIANAGSNLTALVNETVAFSGALSSDPDGSIISYKWNFGDGSYGNGITVSHSFAAAGTYMVALTVMDNLGAASDCFVMVTVSEPVLPPNQPPQANAGADAVATAGQPVSFSGSGSLDPDGTITSYNWDFGDGTSAAGLNVSKIYSAAGTYTVTLTVVDNQNAMATATTHVSVALPVLPNQPPKANAGPDIVATVGQSVSFSGAASSDPDGSIVSYSWNYGDGSSGSGVATTKSYSQPGSYTVTLTVTDNAGAQASDTALVTVHNPPNQPPVANAGQDITATRGKSVTLSGAASFDPDGSISSYRWNFCDGSSATGANVTKTFSNSGTCTASLTVTDNSGARATDTVIVTVVQNQAPVAVAGPDLVVTKGKTVNFSGAASYDPDGSIAYYSWNFGDGTTKSGLSVTKSYATAGTYTVTLTVTDSYGAKSTDTAQVTVTAPPPPVYIPADQAQLFTSLSSRTSRDSYSSSDITTKLKDGILTDLYKISSGSSSSVVSMKLNRDAETVAQVILRVYVSSISGSQTLRVYPYNSDGQTPNTSNYKEVSVSGKGWVEIDVTALADKMHGYGWMKFRLTINSNSAYVGEGNFILR